MDVVMGMAVGFVGWFFVRYGLGGFYTVNQDERAVKTRFGRAQRLEATLATLDQPEGATMRDSERSRYAHPHVRVIPPGGPYFKFPWEQIHKVSISTKTVSIAFDPDDRSANAGGKVLEAVTKDQLNTGLTGQLRYTVSERNLYAYLFGVKRPLAHVMGYFVSILRQRIANFEAPAREVGAPALPAFGGSTDNATERVVQGISINDLRKNLRDLNDHMERECTSSAARYGIAFDAALITGIDPPNEVESALAAINTAHNQVSSEISLAQAAADQRIVQSRRAVEIETLKADAEVEPLKQLAAQLALLKNSGPGALRTYLRYVRLSLVAKVRHAVVESRE